MFGEESSGDSQDYEEVIFVMIHGCDSDDWPVAEWQHTCLTILKDWILFSCRRDISLCYLCSPGCIWIPWIPGKNIWSLVGRIQGKQNLGKCIYFDGQFKVYKSALRYVQTRCLRETATARYVRHIWLPFLDIVQVIQRCVSTAVDD